MVPQLRYYRVKTLDDAYELLNMEDGEILAGGTDILPRLRLGIASPLRLVDVTSIPALRRFEYGEEGLRIGAAISLDEISNSGIVRRFYPSLADAAESVASWQIRNRGTIGGNICQDTRCHYYNQTEEWRRCLGSCYRTGGDVCYQFKRSDHCVALYYSDMAPMLAALGATVVISGEGEERSVEMNRLPRAPGVKPHKRGELVKEIMLPPIGLRTGQVYLREASRGGVDFPLVSLGIVVSLSETGQCLSANVVLGAVAPGLQSVDGVADILNCEGLCSRAYEKIADLAVQLINPIPDYGYPPGYRRELAYTLVRRGLDKAVQLASKKKGLPDNSQK